MDMLSSRNGPCGRRMGVIHMFGVSPYAETVPTLLEASSKVSPEAVGSVFRNIIPQERWTRSSEP